MFPRCAIVFATLCTCFSPAAAFGAVTAWTDVVVRVYDTSGIMAGANLAALEQARKTLEAASIDVIWRFCGSVSPKGSALHTSPSCHAPMAPGELAIRIVRLPVPPGFRGPLPLGDAMLDARTGNGVLATIYFDRVEWLAHQAGSDSRELLGRTIAHELGHLLLASATHGPVGLMRAFWSEEELRRSRDRDWRFAPTELTAIRRRAEARRIESSRTWGTR